MCFKTIYRKITAPSSTTMFPNQARQLFWLRFSWETWVSVFKVRNEPWRDAPSTRAGTEKWFGNAPDPIFRISRRISSPSRCSFSITPFTASLENSAAITASSGLEELKKSSLSISPNSATKARYSESHFMLSRLMVSAAYCDQSLLLNITVANTKAIG